MKKQTAILVTIAVGGLAVWWWSAGHRLGHMALSPVAKEQPLPIKRPEPEKIAVTPPEAVVPTSAPLVQSDRPAPSKTVKSPPPETPAPGPRWADPVAKEALGRVALSFVGADPDAEEVWLWTINDPNLPQKARKNLIEDLNEDGLSDPKNPGPQDLPLIMNRMRLIAELAPSAMDQINQDAFSEAFKDLTEMYVNLAR